MSEWTPAAQSVWGKTDRDDDAWMPLVRHLEDALEVGRILWDQWLPAAVRARIGREFPGGEHDARVLFIFLCAAHDVGKAHYSFAIKANRVGMGRLVDAMAAQGLHVPSRLPVASHQHWTVGYVSAVDWAELRYGLRRAKGLRLLSAIGVHHGVAPDEVERGTIRATTAIDAADARLRAWVDVQHEILDTMARRTGLDGVARAWGDVRLSAPAQSLLSGAVVVADWLASDTARFPYDDPRTSRERARSAVTGWDLPEPWRADGFDRGVDEVFRSRFRRPTGTVRPVQRAAVEAAQGAAGVPLIVIEAGTGEGKTEAALLAAEVLGHRFGAGGVIIALPTQATSDAMLTRFRDWVQALPGIGRTSMFLAHGKAGLNDDFRGLVRAGRFHGVEDEFETERESRAVVTSWLRGRRVGVLANFVVGTIDQVLFGALNARHLPLRQLALAGKVVIIDEAHAADEYMRVYLRRILEWLGAMGTPVVLLSATLPPDIRDSLTAAYAAGAQIEAPLTDRDDRYPRVTVVAAQPAPVEVEPGGHVQRCVSIDVAASDVADDEVIRAVEAGACVAVICDTVARAQETFARLRSRCSVEAILVHSRLLAPERATRERRIRDLLGPPTGGSGIARPRGLLVVGTQVLEASLDYDVDLMVTDLAPMDLIIQRAGRLHRHMRGVDECDRPAGYRQPRLLVTGLELVPDGPPLIDKGLTVIYGEASLLRAAAVMLPLLSAVEPMRIPADVPSLVRRAYDEELAAPSRWDEVWQQAHTEAASRRAEREHAAGAFVIRPPGTVASPSSFGVARSGEPDETGQAQVRDAEATLEVVVVRQVGDELRPMPECGLSADVLLPTDLDPPADHIARVLSACTLRLPAWLTKHSIDIVIADIERQCRHLTGWQRSAWLRGELVLILSDTDDALSAVVAGFRLTYDRELGLLVGKEEDNVL